MKLKPRPVIVPNEQHIEACQKHLTEISGEYGRVVIVNLVSNRFIESVISQRINLSLMRTSDIFFKFKTYVRLEILFKI